MKALIVYIHTPKIIATSYNDAYICKVKKHFERHVFLSYRLIFSVHCFHGR